MDYSSPSMWNIIVQVGIIAATLLIANVVRRKIPFIRKSLMPTAVLGGFLLLALKLCGILIPDPVFLEKLTYHSIAIGFIALSLRVPESSDGEGGKLIGLKSGAVIVSTYMIQGVVGLAVSLGLAYTIMPDLFKAAGVLLPMGYGQGPGQANNIGMSYEALGFAGGRSFGLAIAAAGYVCACVVGVIYLNILSKKGKVRRGGGEEVSGSVTVDAFQSEEEIPVAESLDRFSVQAALVIIVYMITYFATYGVTTALSTYAPGLANMLNSLLWGFNFIIGSAFAMAARAILKGLRNKKLMKRQYQNNYLLSRISGLAFDLMIVAGVASIEPEDLSGLWLPFGIMAALGAIVTLIHLSILCKRIYGDYYYEALVSMYGMMTGTISSGVLLLREIDSDLKTPAANNLVVGSSFGILLGIPLLILVSLAPKSPTWTLVTMGLLFAYMCVLVGVTFIKPKKKKDKDN